MTEVPPRAGRACKFYMAPSGEELRTVGPKCSQGMNLSPGFYKTLPCIDLSIMPRDVFTCDLREDWTEEERAAWRAYVSTKGQS